MIPNIGIRFRLKEAARKAIKYTQQQSLSNAGRHKSIVGYSVAELLVIIVAVGLLIPAVLFGTGGFYDSLLSSLSLSTNDTDTRSALSTIATDLRDVKEFSASLGVASTMPIGVNGAGAATGSNNWSYCGTASSSVTCDGVVANDYTKNRVLIAYNYATDGVPSSSATMSVFTNNGSAFNLSSTTPATNAYIYFVAPDLNNASQKNLYRRTIVNVDPTTDALASTGYWCYDSSKQIASSCTAPYQKTSCTSTMVASYPSVCKARDAVLLYNIESFWIDYYDASNQPIVNCYTNNATNAATAAANISSNATSIQMTITKKPLANSNRSVASLRLQTQ